MRLTERDKQIVLTIYRYRLLSAVQVEALLFSSSRPRGKRTVCQRRLQLLYQHQYLDRLKDHRIIGEGRSPLVYALDKRGGDLVANELGVDRSGLARKPSLARAGHLFLKHTLAINSVRLIMTSLPQTRPLVVEEWLDEADLKAAGMREKLPYHHKGMRKNTHFPDGYFCLQLIKEGQKAHFFLEVDMGTMTNKRWQGKVRSYLHFRKVGLAQEHYGTGNFRVLTVTTTERRLQNLKAATERVRGDDHFWFTTADRLDIWQPESALADCWAVATTEDIRSLF